jgi:hypothetical protein
MRPARPLLAARERPPVLYSAFWNYPMKSQIIKKYAYFLFAALVAKRLPNEIYAVKVAGKS